MFASSHVLIIAGASIDVDATLGFELLLFIGLYVILHPLLIKPYMKAMEVRREELEGSKEDAGEFEIRAEKALADYERKMRDARREAQEVRESLKTQGSLEFKEIVAEAREELSAKIEDERLKVVKQHAAAADALKERSAALAEVIVQKVLPLT